MASAAGRIMFVFHQRNWLRAQCRSGEWPTRLDRLQCRAITVAHRSFLSQTRWTVAAISPISTSKLGVSGNAGVAHRLNELVEEFTPPEIFQNWLAQMSGGSRGRLLEAHCREIYNTLYPCSAPPSDAPVGVRVNGSSAGKNGTLCDFLSGDTRVEVKSTLIAHHKHQRRWMFRWLNVKPHEFDQLILIGITPRDIIFWEWDNTTGFHAQGERTSVRGGVISVAASSSEQGLDDALGHLTAKISWKCLRRVTVAELPKPATSSTRDIYHENQLHKLQPQRRATLLSKLCREMYASTLYPGSNAEIIAMPQGCGFLSGRARVSVKTSALSITNGRWRFYWSSIKMGEFDKLLLVGHAPGELLIWEWGGHSGVSSAGVRTSLHGSIVQKHGRAGQSWQDSLAHIKSNPPGLLLLSVVTPR
eukprot:GHVR01097343.1.p1 GENE.GHVR01097343.1~~GHVR01097343.1.p1  ORF type:complete len:418 (-),score=22.56 GHVR01097343.1:194-1447(-)